MKKKFSIYGIYLPIFLVVFLPVVVMQSVVYITKPDVAIDTLGRVVFTGYFTDTVMHQLTGWAVALASVFFLTYIFTADKGMKLIPSFASPLNYIPAAISGAALLFISAHLFTVTSFGNDATTMTKLAPLVAILALLSVGYFAASAIYVRRRSIRRSDFGIILLAFLCAYVAYMFFDSATPINSPVRVANQTAYLSVAMFFLYETRLSLGREKWRAYISLNLITAMLTGYASIPALLSYFIKGYVYGLSIYETVLTFSFFVYAAFRLVLNGALIPECGSKLVRELIEYSKARDAELAPVAEETESIDVADENQMSIADITIEAEVIDAPTPEEGFLLEQEITLSEDEVAVPLQLEDADYISYEKTEEIIQTTDEESGENEENIGN
ncbi:MAG: hypothetical protein J6Q69_03455 [Clostridia bacterium]|nr:hypothetical protein [Clostridia bacterium]